MSTWLLRATLSISIVCCVVLPRIVARTVFSIRMSAGVPISVGSAYLIMNGRRTICMLTWLSRSRLMRLMMLPSVRLWKVVWLRW
uniref:Putative secreted protein n=1 Tax=Anopheles darlingi TaxID=43151 RepID=A0A2M4D8B0_ANODA